MNFEETQRFRQRQGVTEREGKVKFSDSERGQIEAWSYKNHNNPYLCPLRYRKRVTVPLGFPWFLQKRWIYNTRMLSFRKVFCPQTRLGSDSNTEPDMTRQPGPVDILAQLDLPNNWRTFDQCTFPGKTSQDLCTVLDIWRNAATAKFDFFLSQKAGSIEHRSDLKTTKEVNIYC